MAIHDAWPRLTPYELLLPEPGFADRRFPAIADEAGTQGMDAGNPAVFVMLGAVQGVLAELRTDDDDSASAHDHGVALFFAWQLWRTGPSVALARTSLLRRLLADGAGSSLAENPWTAELRARAGYIQLPQHLVWVEEGDAGGRGHAGGQSPESPRPAAPASSAASPSEPGPPPPQSVDGFFWFGDEMSALHLALVAGMRSDRPGFALVPLPPQPLRALPGWAAGPAREDGPDFACSLPGAEIEGLLALRTPAEVFKLAAPLLHRFLRRGPDALSSPPPRDPAGASASSAGSPARPASPGPRPSALPFVIL